MTSKNSQGKNAKNSNLQKKNENANSKSNLRQTIEETSEKKEEEE